MLEKYYLLSEIKEISTFRNSIKDISDNHGFICNVDLIADKSMFKVTAKITEHEQNRIRENMTSENYDELFKRFLNVMFIDVEHYTINN
jgi:hypothetical protein